MIGGGQSYKNLRHNVLQVTSSSCNLLTSAKSARGRPREPPRSSSDAREVTLPTPTPLPHDTSPPYTNVNNVTSTSTSIPSRLRSVPEVSDPTNTAHTYNRHPSSTPELSSKTSNSDHVTWVQSTTAPTWVKTSPHILPRLLRRYSDIQQR